MTNGDDSIRLFSISQFSFDLVPQYFVFFFQDTLDNVDSELLCRIGVHAQILPKFAELHALWVRLFVEVGFERPFDHFMHVLAMALQVRLPLPEQRYCGKVHIELMVENIRVCPFEGLSAHDHLVIRIAQKFHLMQRYIMKLDHLVHLNQSSLIPALLRFSLGLLVCQEFPVVKLVSSHVTLSSVLGTLRFLEFFLLGRLRVQIAHVVATGLRPVVRPVAHTDPAKVMLAICALHVIATTVFFDATVAVRAWFCEGLEPSRSCTTV